MRQKYEPSDFYLNRKGPWPQPSPIHPWKESPAVIHVPFREILDWWIFVGLRYLLTLLLSPIYLLKGIWKPGLKEVSDDRFEWYLNETMISKFITDKLDHKDINIFKIFLDEFQSNKQSSKDWYIIDLEAVKEVKPFPEIYCSASKVLLFKIENRFKVECIYIGKTQNVFTNDDGDAWELAKYFVLQGAALCSTLVTHPNQHFPNDSINAIIKSSLPKEHLLFKLLYPHLRFTLPLENAVLNYKSSLLNEKWWMPYAPYPGGPSGLRNLLVDGYKGIKGNASYPPFSFSLKKPDFETNYGIYLQTYYKVVSKFVEKIVKDIPKDDIWTKRWAKYVSQYVNDFPDDLHIFEQGILHKSITSYLFTITIGHSVDHYNYGVLDKREIPLRIRQEPPVKGIKLKERSKLCSPFDLMKYYMADTLFFSSTTVTSLVNTKYLFKTQEHQKAVKEFKCDLADAERELLAKGIVYMPLKKIASSIQF